MLALALALLAGGGDFPVFVWCREHPDGPLPPALVEAFGGANVEGTADATWAREQGLELYVGHAPGRDALHIDRDAAWYDALWQAYWDERDARALVREPCLSEPDTRAELVRRLVANVERRGDAYGRGYSLGDEVGLTRYGGPLDLCTSDACRAAFARFVAASPRWRPLLAADDAPLPYPDTDAVRRAWTDGDPRLVAAWMARREFHHAVVVDVLRELARAGRAAAPEAPLGLLGLGGRTAFGGVGVDAVLPALDFLEAYPLLETRELLYTLRQQQRSWTTVFSGAPGVAGARLREHWLRGGDAAVLWSDRELASDAAYFAEAAAAVAEVRRLRAAWPDWNPKPFGVAVVHDPEAMALSWLRDALQDGPTWPKRFASWHEAHGTREVLLRAVLRLAEDVGCLPGALPFERVEPHTIVRFPVLVLVQQVVLEEVEVVRLESYLRAGGRVLVVGDFDRWDLAGRPSTLDARARLEAAGEDRVATLALDGARYLEARTDPDDAWARQRQVDLRVQTVSAEVDRGRRRGASAADGRYPAWRVSGAPCPWLVAQVPGVAPGTWCCAALPNPAPAGDAPLRVRLDGLRDAAPTWLAPRQPCADGTVELRPGEALVFTLRAPEGGR